MQPPRVRMGSEDFALLYCVTRARVVSYYQLLNMPVILTELHRRRVYISVVVQLLFRVFSGEATITAIITETVFSKVVIPDCHKSNLVACLTGYQNLNLLIFRTSANLAFSSVVVCITGFCFSLLA